MPILYEIYSGQSSDFCNHYTAVAAKLSNMDSQHDRLRRARMAKGYKTAYACAEAFGWSKNTYSANENGNAPFGLKAAKKYGEALGVDPYWLLDRDHKSESGPIKTNKTLLTLGDLVVEVPILYTAKYGFIRRGPQSGEASLGNIYITKERFKDVDLFAAQVGDESFARHYPQKSVVIVARPSASRPPRSNNDVLLHRRDVEGKDEIGIYRFERDGKTDVFVSLADGERFAPDPSRDKWKVLGQIVGHGFWPADNPGEIPSSLGNMDEAEEDAA